MGTLIDLQERVQLAIDGGLTTLEGAHRTIAEIPLGLLEKIEPLAEPIQGIRDVQNNIIGTVYESLRVVNEKVGEMIARRLE